MSLLGFTDWVGGVWDLLTGKPQTWYDRVDAAQKALAVRAAEVNAVGAAPWNAVRDAFFAASQGPELEFLSFSDINEGITKFLKSLIITRDHAPGDDEISHAENYNRQYGRYIDYVKSMLPEIAAQVAADAEAVRSALGQGRMGSPSAVGKQALIDELERRAKLLGAGLGLAALAYLAIPVVLMAAFSGGRR